MKKMLVVMAAALLAAGCICQPGGKIVNYWGWRSVQVESCTNVVQTIDGGGRVDVTAAKPN
jgi:hypothetical protein